MSDAFTDWYVHTVSVRTIQAVAEDGAQTFAAPVQVACWQEESVKLVRDTAGAEVASPTQLHLALEFAALFAPGSLVTLSNGREARVLSRSTTDSVGGDPDLDGCTVSLS